MWIPVKFVALLDNNTKNWVKDKYVLNQLQVLNNEYKRMEIPIRLLMTHIIYVHHTEWHRACRKLECTVRGCTFQYVVEKFVNKPKEEITIFICHAEKFAGFSTFPWLASENSKNHYLILTNNSMVYEDSNSPEWIESLPKTFVHELGHYFGLLHTFETPGTCEGKGDYVNDTPQTLNAGTTKESCTTVKNSCPNLPGNDMKDNYMDYYARWCRYVITKGQIERMKKYILVFRPALMANTLVTSIGASCDDSATPFEHCNCGPGSLCSPAHHCRISINPLCHGLKIKLNTNNNALAPKLRPYHCHGVHRY